MTPMTNDQRDNILIEISGNTQAIRQKLDDHIKNPVIHTVPPCEAHKALTTKLWAIGVAAFTALAGMVWSHLK